MAFGNSTFGNIGGAVNDLFSSRATAKGLRLRGEGNIVEADNYDGAAVMARKNAEFTRQSTEVKEAMSQRRIYLGIGQETADIAGAGFLTSSGSALDLLRSSQGQAGLEKSLLAQQGLITEAGYNEQANAFTKLAGFARMSAGVQNEMAGDAETAGKWSAGIKTAAAVTSLFI